MPTYVYGCDACGHQFEQFQKFSDEPIRTCPRCAKQVRRIFQPAGIVFKGSGWHITDYKRGGSNGNGESKANGNGESKANGNGENTSNGESKANGSGASSNTESSAPVASAAAEAA
jgi:putative FmdB family regulatory protein